MTIVREWESEPDELLLSAFGYPCVALRGPSKHWCGYVGIPKHHALFGKGYNDVIDMPKRMMGSVVDSSRISVIALFCQDPDEAAQNKFSLDLLIDVHGGLTWAADHVPSKEPDGLWWFGFDCAHAGDLAPDLFDGYEFGEDGTYRNVNYVIKECNALGHALYHFRNSN